MTAEKALVVGWDGATWAYIDPLLAEGRLPNLAQLLNDGARFTLRSTLPPYTNVAWPSLVTGLSPVRTGVYDATAAHPGGYEAEPTNVGGHRGTPIWTWLNQFGQRCGVLNIPMTFPALPIDGYMVSGFDSVAQSGEVVFPRGMLERWRADGRPYTILEEEIALMASQNPHQKRGDLEPFVRRWVELTQRQGVMTRWLWDNYPVDFLFVVFSGTDSINHRTQEAQAIARVYEAADQALGELLEGAGDKTLVCLLSDHGSGPAHHYLSLNRALYDAGWLRFKPQIATRSWQRLPGRSGKMAAALWKRVPGVMQRLLSWPLLRLEPRLAVAYENIDWGKSSVYARTGLGPLYVNRQGHRGQGIVPEENYEYVRGEVIAYLEGLRDREGRRLFDRVRRYEEVYAGTAAPGDDRPDLIFTPRRWSDHPVTGFPGDPLLRPVPADRPYGTHTRDGILALKGPGVTAGATYGVAEIFDVTPTLLAGLDQPLPLGLDGRPLLEALGEALELKWAEPLAETSHPQEGYRRSEEANEEISERLRALGYLE